jgi:hypothetical protein
LVQKPLDGTDNAWNQERGDIISVPYSKNYGKQVNGLTTEINLAFRQVVTQTYNDTTVRSPNGDQSKVLRGRATWISKLLVPGEVLKHAMTTGLSG